MSRISLSTAEKDSDSALINNRAKFKKIFGKHLPNREGKITLQEFTKFCQNVRILPDLISPIDLKKLIALLSIKLNISFFEFETIIKNIASQTFNNTAPLCEKLRMLLIHIRNSCKMHYQVSLNQNVTKEVMEYEGMQDPVEIEGHNIEDNSKPPDLEKVYFGRYMSISPPRDNDSQSKSRVTSMKKLNNKDRSVSPCNSIEILDKVLQQRTAIRPYRHEFLTRKKSNPLEIPSQRKSISPYQSTSPVSTSPIQNIRSLFNGFCNKHIKAQASAPRSYTARRVQSQLKFIQTVRRTTFQSQFVKKLIFNAWKAFIKNKKYKRNTLEFN